MLLNFVDKNFDKRNIYYYRLSIQVSLNGFSFSVFDTKLSKHILLRNYQYQRKVSTYDELGKEIGIIIETDEYLALDYPFCTCMYISPKHTLIPKQYFSELNLRKYLEFVSPIDELDELHYFNFPNTDIYSIYIFPSPVAAKIASYYKKGRFINQATPLIYKVLADNANKNGIYINLYDGVADMAVQTQDGFKLHNSFEIYHLNDAVYYIYALIRQFQFNVKDTPINISGDILREEIDEISKYFPLLNINNNHRMSMLIGQENSYRYYNLLNAHECE